MAATLSFEKTILHLNSCSHAATVRMQLLHTVPDLGSYHQFAQYNLHTALQYCVSLHKACYLLIPSIPSNCIALLSKLYDIGCIRQLAHRATYFVGRVTASLWVRKYSTHRTPQTIQRQPRYQTVLHQPKKDRELPKRIPDSRPNFRYQYKPQSV